MLLFAESHFDKVFLLSLISLPFDLDIDRGTVRRSELIEVEGDYSVVEVAVAISIGIVAEFFVLCYGDRGDLHESDSVCH